LDPGGSKKIVIHVDPDSDLIDPEDKYLDPGGSKKRDSCRSGFGSDRSGFGSVL
jgi:hypothetical protein